MKKINIILTMLLLTSFATASFFINNHPKSNNNLKEQLNYEKEWEKVDSLIAKGLPKSALEIVDKIYLQAKLYKDAAQHVKTVIYRIKLKADFEEDFLVKSIDEINTEINTSYFPVTSVLHSVLSEMYMKYYQNNIYNILDRTETVDFKQGDIKTWDIKKIIEKVIFHYMKSVENSKELQNVKTDIFDPVIIKDSTTRKFRPTLYDFLAHRAIDFFMSGKAEIIKPAYAFEINNNDYFASPDVFTKLNINTLDTFSFRYYALNLLKDVEKFHINDNDPGALIDATLKRLNFVRKNSITDEKDSLYLKTLIELNEKYNYSEHSALISYAVANEYLRLGRLYNPLQSDEHKNDIKTAYKICKNAVDKFPNSDGAANCRVLIENMEQKSISVLNEYVEVPDKVFRALISYKNIEDVYFRIIKIDPDKNLKLTEKYYDKELIKQYIKMSPVKEWSIKLPEDDDMQNHSVEIAMPELSFGFYVILAGSTEDFSVDNFPVAYGNIWISNISYISRANEDYSYDIYVLDRTSGKAIEDATVETYYREYNYSSRSYETKKWKTFTSDNNGYVFIPAMSDSKYSRYFYADFKKGKDYLATKNYFYQYRYDEQGKKYNKTYFFTDRAIYRPGQTIYFKAILLEKEGENYKIRPNTKTRVAFYDANYQEVTTLELISNEYGSVSGTFTAPQGGLNGQMYITDTYGYKYFNVEEYKRPKFEVSFNPIKGSYKLDEEVTVKGKALAYAGSNIDGATVKYRVVRTARFPYWGWWWRMPQPSSPSMEIISGSTITDENGEFEVKFKAIPDKNVTRKYMPVFNYSVTADVTDINGETHSSNSNISVGYKALILNIQMPENIEKSEKNIFQINALNLNGEKEPTAGIINIYKLKQPQKVFRQRLWTRPDKYLLSRNEYYRLFPFDLYNNEDDKSKWEKAEKMLTLSFDTKKDSVFDATRFKNWKEGQYILEITAKDAFGETVENKNYFTLYSKKSNTIPEITTCWFNTVNTKGEPGDKASFIVGTKEKDVSVLYEIANKHKIIYKECIKLSNEQKYIEIPITEEHRGNFAIQVTFVKNGRSYYNSAVVAVPYTDKELDIQFETFRNKLLPGQAEEWKIRIKGKNGEKVAAEMIAAMYDASLDAFTSNYWDFNILNYYYNRLSWQTNETFTSQASSSVYNYKNKYVGVYYKYDFLNWFGLYYFNQYKYEYYGDEYDLMVLDGITTTSQPYGGVKSRSGRADVTAKAVSGEMAEADFAVEEMSIDEDASGYVDKKNAEIPLGLKQSKDFSGVQIRSNFNETAFFLPQLETDEKGDIIIKFTVPEALTKWKMMGFAHTKELKYGMIQKELITQKDLMVIPNPPRFFREFDKITFSAKISNVSDKDLEGEARLEFFDAMTMKPIDTEVQNINTNKSFSVTKGQSTSLNWDIFIPDGIGAITYRIVAKAGNFSDGEEMAIPVLTNRMLVTESLPLPINGKQSKNFTFVKLINSEKSSTLKNHKLTLEFTSNPAWYAIQALPYLMEYPYECSEQVFSRYYANSIASYIANSSPKIKAVFDSWKNFTPDALLSNLEKNQELKALMLEETPWVLNAKSESERKKRVALLFDLTRMANELDRAERLLIKKQSSNGGWPWFEGMPESRYITQHIITGFGHLLHLGIKDIKENRKVWSMIEKGVKYLDARIKEDYDYIKKHFPKYIDENHLSYDNIQYLYARSYFLNDIKINRVNQESYDYFKKQAQKYWIDNNIYMQGMISLALHRNSDTKTASDIIRSLKEKALHSEEMGMYWRDLAAGYYWYQAPIETQALLIEAFDEVANDKIAVEEMKIWLLKQKQTQDWKTTKATTEACYALLLRGTDVLASKELVLVSLGNQIIDPAKLEGVKAEAGTGYFKTSWSGSDIKPEMGNVKVTKNDEGVAWGALYWQYFEQLDKITPAETPLKLNKKLFRKFNTETGPKIEPVNEKTILKVGDKITVRIELRVDRDMEYVHMKDMRASGFEPINVFSGYKYQGGLGYYESTRDAATNFFFAYLNKGTYVFEYPLVVSHKGDFSNGITTIQCMYAPEFSSHSEGIRIKVN